jgi:hypothetical protein
MSTLIKSLAAASFLTFGATTLLAQTQTEPPRPPTAQGEVKDEKPTDPNLPRQPEVKQLEKEKRLGNEGKGN